METFHMADILPKLPLPAPPRDRSAYYVPCPKCDRSGRKKEKHLNISLTKDVFRCARCGWNGGIFDLYAYYTNTPRDKVRDELKRVLGSDGPVSYNQSAGRAAYSVQPALFEPATADIEVRHSVYSMLLSMLSLAPDHMRNLISRGLLERAILENEYRTSPAVGGKHLAKQIQSKGLSLLGVPGFYTDSDGQWTFISMWRGILVPVRDTVGRIQGLQVRRDNQEKRKYRWVSSADISLYGVAG